MLRTAGSVIDGATSAVTSKYLPPAALNALKALPLGKISVSNTLASNDDVYVQAIIPRLEEERNGRLGLSRGS